ncbi:CpaF/VirB11 family protein, partial [Mycobacterium tuberculosis]|uniref:CpaF/VirB11 family protein n=1 Tax=Mycobacterium tuberculosis TaxID=1773 RepID=UPI001587458E
EQCIQYGNISQDIADFLTFIVPKEPSIVVSGGTNSGKTTQLMRIPLFLDPMTRIITIEDSEEMMLAEKSQYANYPNIVSLLSKELESEAKSYGTSKLVKASMRLNPTYMIIGEIRDEEGAKQGVNAANTGHPLLTSTHANNCRAAAIRLLQLSGNTTAVASQIGDTIDLIISQVRLKNGVRTVTEISELLGYEGTEKPILNPIFK